MTETISPLDRFVAERIMQHASTEFDERLAQARRGPYPLPTPPTYTPASPQQSVLDRDEWKPIMTVLDPHLRMQEYYERWPEFRGAWFAERIGVAFWRVFIRKDEA